MRGEKGDFQQTSLYIELCNVTVENGNIKDGETLYWSGKFMTKAILLCSKFCVKAPKWPFHALC